MTTKAAHLIFYVRDQAASCAFYRAVLARTATLDVPGMTEFAIAPSTVLGLMPEAGIRRLFAEKLPELAEANGTPRAELYLVVDDAAAHHARALAAGATELSGLSKRDWGHHVAYSLDPDGYVLAFATSE
jgi:catechol 2,3-dioxygenase-like lactoylglutathione lyase family enzyme